MHITSVFVKIQTTILRNDLQLKDSGGLRKSRPLFTASSEAKAIDIARTMLKGIENQGKEMGFKPQITRWCHESSRTGAAMGLGVTQNTKYA